jgi:ribosomal protein S18 acetylase RimI-like enzyme
MPNETLSQIVIRRARDDELAAVLRLWNEAGVTPPSVTDSTAGLTGLIKAQGGILLVATIDDPDDRGDRDERIIGSAIGGWDGWRGNIYRLAVAPERRERGLRGGWWSKSAGSSSPRAP